MSKGLPRSLARGKGKQTVRKHVIKVKDLAVAVAATGSAVGFGTAVLGDLPEGNILFLGAAAYLDASTSDSDIATSWHGDFSVGTTATADVTLDGTDVNVIPSTTLDAVAATKASAVTRAVNATGAFLDNTDGSLELNLNVLVDAADIGNDAGGDITFNGVVEVVYAVVLDD